MNNKLDELKNLKKNLRNDNKKLKEIIDLNKRNNDYLFKGYNKIKDKVKEDEVKIHDMLNKFNGNMINNMNNLSQKFNYKKMSIVLN